MNAECGTRFLLLMQSFQQVTAGKKKMGGWRDDSGWKDYQPRKRHPRASLPPGSCRSLSRGWVLVRDQGLRMVRGGRLWLCGQRPYFVEKLTKVFRRETVSWQSFALVRHSTIITKEGIFAARKAQSCCTWETGMWTFTVLPLLIWSRLENFCHLLFKN